MISFIFPAESKPDSSPLPKMTEVSDSEIELSEDEFEGFGSEDIETDNINDELSAEESESVKESDNEFDDEDGVEEEVTASYNGVADPETAETVSKVEIAPLTPLVAECLN